MSGFSLRQLQYFVTAAESGSLAEAAQRLNVSQPSMSAAIAKLEAQLGLRLFVRHHAQGISLTHAGRTVLGDARSLLRQAHDFRQFAETLGDPMHGELHVGCFSTFAPAVMPALLTGYRRDHPGVTIRLVEAGQRALIDGLESGALDLALVWDLELPERMARQTLASYQPYALLPHGHRLAGHKRVTLEALAREPMILLDEPPSRNYFSDVFHRVGLTPQVAFTSSSIEMVRGLVGRGAGFTLLVTRPHGERTYDGGRLALRPLADRAPTSEICLVRLEQSPPNRLMASFAAFCAEWFAEARPFLD